MNSTNTVDANDTGREIQVAIYDPDRAMQGCAHDASCRTGGTSCGESITYLGWNPVQGGNRCNNGSGIDSVHMSTGELTITTRPFQWNPNWDNSGCSSAGCTDATLAHRTADIRLTQTIRFVHPHVVELTYSIDNLSGIDHAATYQELPTLYAANGTGGPDLWRMLDASGTHIPIDTDAGGDGWYYENFSSSAPWVTLQNTAHDYGVGILQENGITEFQAWQDRSVPFNNVRSLFEFGLPGFATVTGRAYLLIGGFGTISTEANWTLNNLAPFGELEAPTPEASAPHTLNIEGWALDNRGIASIEAIVDEFTTVPLAYGAPRSDVCIEWPGYPGCGGVGFSGSFNTSGLGGGPDCGHLIEIVATDTDGNRRTIDQQRFFKRP